MMVDLQFPNGLTPDGEPRANVGRVFFATDSRWPSSNGDELHKGVKCVVRFLAPGDVGKYPRFEERLAALRRTAIPYVCAPYEAAMLPDGSVYLVEEYLGEPLSSRIQGHQGLKANEANSLIEEVLTGLAGLHRLDLAHGDLRPENVFLGHGRQGVVLIAHAAVGGIVQPDRDYLELEHDGGDDSPSKKADLYALGLIACEAVLGRSAVSPKQPADGALCDAHFQRDLCSKLRKRGAGRAYVALVTSLLADESDRPHDAAQAHKQFIRSQRWASWRSWQAWVASAMVIVILLLLGAGLGWIARPSDADRYRKGQVEKDLATVEKERDQAVDEVHSQSRQLQQLQDEIDALKKPLVARPTAAESVAQAIWKSKLGDKSQKIADELTAWQEVYEDLGAGHLDKLPPDTGFRKLPPEDQKSTIELLAGWLNKTRKLHDDSVHWLPKSTDGVKPLYLSARERPWDRDTWQKAENHLRVLGEAAELWKKWAGNSRLAFGELDGLIEGERARKEVQDVLYRWRSEIIGRKDWTVRFTKGAAPAGYGTDRQITVQDVNDGVHEWDKETKHFYSIPSGDVQFDWTAGQSLLIELERDRSLLRGYRRQPLIKEQPIDGPLAIWQAHKLGMVEHDGFELHFEIRGCPGPPRELFKDPVKSIKDAKD